MERFDIVHPGKGDLVIGPPAAHQDRDLVLASTLKRPVVSRRHALDYFQRISSMIRYFNQGHPCLHLPPDSRKAHSTVYACRLVVEDMAPKGAARLLRGESLDWSTIDLTIPREIAPLSPPKVNDWWISTVHPQLDV